MPNIIIENITKVDEAKDPKLLDNNEAARFDNLILNSEVGKPVKRGGFTVYNTNDVATTIKSLHDIVDINGDNYVMASYGTTLGKSPNGTGVWSTLKTGLTTGLPTRIARYADKFVVTNGTDIPFVTDSFNSFDLQIAKPDISTIVGSYETTPTEFPLTPNSFYRYVLVYTGSDGSYSIPSQPFTNFTTWNAFAGVLSTILGGKIMFKGLPVPSDTRVESKNIYRTLGDGTNAGTLAYYLLATLGVDETEYIDSTPDSDLDLSRTIEYAVDINTAKYLGTAGERTLLANINSDAVSYISPEHTKTDPSPNSGYTTSDIHLAVLTTGAGSLTVDSTYKYRVLYKDSVGVRSYDYIEITAVLTGTENTATLSPFPRLPNKNYTRELYRTVADGSVYKYLATLGDNDEIYTDLKADGSLGIDFPAIAIKDYPSSIAVSQLGQVNHYPAETFIQIFPDDGDDITGVVSGEYGSIVFKRNSICEVITSGSPINWQVLKRVENIGCDEPNSIVKVRNVAYFMNNKHVYRSDSPLKPLSFAKKDTFESITVVYDSAYLTAVNWYVLSVLANGVRRLLIYDERVETWYDFEGVDFEALEEKKYGIDRGIMLASYDSNGLIFRYNEDTKLDYTTAVLSTEVVPHLKTKVFTQGGGSLLVRLRKLFSYYKKKDGQTVNHLFTDPITGETLTSMDTVDSNLTSEEKEYRKITDGMTGGIRTPRALQYEIYGAGLEEFRSVRIKTRDINRGRR